MACQGTLDPLGTQGRRCSGARAVLSNTSFPDVDVDLSDNRVYEVQTGDNGRNQCVWPVEPRDKGPGQTVCLFASERNPRPPTMDLDQGPYQQAGGGRSGEYYLTWATSPCLCYLEFSEAERAAGAHRGCAGVVSLDVDDFVQGGNPRHEGLTETLRLRFKFGKWHVVFDGYGEYLGRTVRKMRDFEIRVDMERYITEKLRVITLPRQRLRDGEEAELSDHEISLLRGAAGSLLWVGKDCRPDCGAACAMSMSWGSSKPRIKHIKAANKVISELQKTASVYLRVPPLNMDEAIWMSVSDASLANDDEKSQGGYTVCYVHKGIMAGKLAQVSLICRKSHKLRRTVKASLGSEAMAMDDGMAELEWLRAMHAEVCIPEASVTDMTRYGPDESVVAVRQSENTDDTIMVTDARALYDLYQRRSGAAGLDRRAQIDVSVLAASLPSCISVLASGCVHDVRLSDQEARK